MTTRTRRRRTLQLLLATALVASWTPCVPAAGAPTSGPQAPQPGDLLVDNHDFSADLAGWSTGWEKRRHTVAPRASCASTATVIGSDAAKRLSLAASRACERPVVQSSPVTAQAGTRYVAWSTVSQGSRGAEVGLVFTDAAGKPLEATWTGQDPRAAARQIRAEAVAPRAAANVVVALSTDRTAGFDDVLVSAQLTDLGTQLSVPSSANGSAYSTDGAGHDMSYSVMVGAHGVDARLAGIRLDTRTLEFDIPVPGAMGAWNAHATDDGTVYIGSYNYADPAIGGHLYSYTPGADEVVDLGAPVPGDTFVYGVSAGPDGSIIGGTYPSGTLWKYSADVGFSTIGSRPVLPGIQYVRAVAYDPVTDLVFAGTGGTAHIVACPADGGGSCTEVLPWSYAHYPWVYNLAAGEGRVFARVTDDHGDDHLVVIKPSVADDGTISAEVEKDLPGLSFPGTTQPVDGAVYYAKSARLFRYDIASGVETDLGANTTIFARQWVVRRMADQGTFPGDTVVGINSGGIIATYGIQNAVLRVGTVDRLPKGIADIESIVGGPDGRIYSSGYLIGGMSAYSPLLGRAPQQYSAGLGYGQGEGMAVLGGRVYLGVYPGAHLRSFEPETADEPAREDCQIGEEQDRPYAMLAAPNGRLYAGTMAIYGQLSGALTEYDPSTGECSVHRDIVPNQSVVSAAWAGERVVVGSLVWGGLGVPATEPEAKLAVFDPGTKTAHTIDLPVDGLRSVTAMTTDRRGRVWLLAQNYVMSFDPRTARFSNVRQVYPELRYGDGPDGGRISAYDSQLATAPDGRVFGTIRGRLFELDTRRGRVQTIATGSFTHVTFDAYGSLYTVSGANRLVRYVPSQASR